MGVNALYNLADTLFVGRGVGGFAVGAIAISFPITVLHISVGLIIGVGGGSLISRALGAKKLERANLILGTALCTALTVALVLTAALHFALLPLLRLLGATEELLPLAYRYSAIIVLGSPFTIVNIMFANLIRSEGRVMWSTIMFTVGAISNIILDAYFIFVLQYGLEGAAYATIISQSLSTVIAITFYLTKKSELRARIAHRRYYLRILITMLMLGVGTAARQWGEIVVLVVANNLLRTVGGSAEISAYGIVHRIVLFSLLPIVGVAHALLPIVGYNWGAQKYARAFAALRFGNRLAFFVGMPIAILEVLFAPFFVNIFIADEHIRAIASHALRIMAFSIPLIPVQLNCAIYFQAIGNGVNTIIIHSARQLCFIAFPMLMSGNMCGISSIWSTCIIGDGLTIILAMLLFRRTMKSPIFHTLLRR